MNKKQSPAPSTTNTPASKELTVADLAGVSGGHWAHEVVDENEDTLIRTSIRSIVY